jgi:DNA-3-methyladenine glycosylase
VGVAYAMEDAYLPYRYSVKGNKWVSKGKGLKK